jgi:NAD(P)-dependent dehydrogenase (short-subunit alcohol dehydrogenase family)
MRSPDKGRTVAITGGASGIGAATAELLASLGWRVAILDRDAERGAAAAAACADGCFVELDVADEASVDTVFEALGARFGSLDGLVNSAGIESARLLAGMTGEQWDRVQAVNVRGTFLCSRAAARLMRAAGRGGSIVNVASIAGKRISYSGDAAYTASKAAVLGFTRHAAFEWAADRIRVNAVCPGPTLTPMITRNLDAERQAAVAAAVPLGRWVQPSDVANAIGFLLADASSMCTGIALDVDGGVLVSNGSRYADYVAARR